MGKIAWVELARLPLDTTYLQRCLQRVRAETDSEEISRSSGRNVTKSMVLYEISGVSEDIRAMTGLRAF